MKSIILFVVVSLGVITTGCVPTKVERNAEYEAYCDSIWNEDPIYYMDVIMESDEYIEYVDSHGCWWEEL